jgi:hypothetical protein
MPQYGKDALGRWISNKKLRVPPCPLWLKFPMRLSCGEAVPAFGAGTAAAAGFSPAYIENQTDRHGSQGREHDKTNNDISRVVF